MSKYKDIEESTRISSRNVIAFGIKWDLSVNTKQRKEKSTNKIEYFIEVVFSASDEQDI